MNPLLLSGLISGGTSLLQGLLGGLGKKSEAKQQFQNWEKMRGRQISDIEKYLKPQQDYYRTPYLPGIDRVMTQAILGNMGSRFGNTLGKWGIDLTDILGTMGLDQPFGQSQQAGYYNNNGISPSPYLRNVFGGSGGDSLARVAPTLGMKRGVQDEPRRYAI